MTERLYFDDSYLTAFEANVSARVRIDERLGIVLDRTAFYPTSGGQPHDTGTINGIPVPDVFVRSDDGAVIHVLRDELWENRVRGEIDWSRRFDHMQQHTGQHVLSAVFLQLLQGETVGFHLGSDKSTIDVALDDLPPNQIEAVEDVVNELIFANRRVRSAVLTPQQAAKLTLRKPPPSNGPVRIVEIEKLDLTACGGTHVISTGELGLLKITKLENRPGGVRVEFVCGRRALADYQLKNRVVNHVSSSLSVGYWELDQAFDRMRQEIKSLRGELRDAGTRVLEFRARELLHQAEVSGGLRVVSHVFSEEKRKDLSWLAKTLVAEPGVVVLFGVAGERSHVLFARAQEVDRDMLLLLKTALRVLGSTAGGGKPEMAQGGGPPADVKRVEQAIDRAKRLLLAQRG